MCPVRNVTYVLGRSPEKPSKSNSIDRIRLSEYARWYTKVVTHGVQNAGTLEKPAQRESLVPSPRPVRSRRLHGQAGDQVLPRDRRSRTGEDPLPGGERQARAGLARTSARP